MACRLSSAESVAPTWFRFMGVDVYGRNGPARRSIAAAWSAYSTAGHAAQPARLVRGTTRRAVESADVSVVRGRVGRGEWWNV